MRKLATHAHWAIVAFAGVTSLALGASDGIKPRASADNYHSHLQQNGIAVGAELLTPKQVIKIFNSDVNRCCLVVEVAVYPKKDETLNLTLDAFSLGELGSDVSMRPESASVVAAAVQKGRDSGVVVTGETTTGIGYESGTRIDPVTGQPVNVHGIYTVNGEKVGAGNEGSTSGRELERAEKELGEKSLPEGKVLSPVAGYLYFPNPKPKKDAKYQFECVVRGEKLVLNLH